MSQNQLAVVTGASSGIGQATAQALAGRGFHVLAGVRRAEDAERLARERIEPVIIDVTDAAAVANVAERVANDSSGRRLHALVNNAGIAVTAPIESIPMDEWRRQFEVNFFGHVAMTRALLPALLEARGRVVNISSIGGRVASPTFGAYAASKFALEAVSDSLRREVSRLGVRVIVIEPGTIATPIWSKGMAAAQELVGAMPQEQRIRYGDLIAAALERARALGRTGMDPVKAAEVIVDAIESDKPRPRYLVGRDAKVMARLTRVLPDRAVDWLIARSLGVGEPSATTTTTSTAEMVSELTG
jgi:NAD(P)-dependent dehydrogenase (short-subunit alcohol dehydrogenase family)